MTPEKHALIRRNLTDAFPGRVIEERKDGDRGTWRFKVLIEPRSLLVAFSEEFIDDSTPDQIQAAFENWRILDLVRDNPDKRILVMTTGTRLEKRE